MSAITELRSQTTTWTIDPSHSDVQFSIKHLGIMTVRGHFGKVAGTAKMTDGLLESFEASIDVASIDTRVADRDKHLRSADFFNVELWPEMSFKSTSITPSGRGTYTVVGDLTLAGQTHPVELDVEVTDTIKDPWGMTRRAAAAHGKISRKQWGLVYNQVLETGGFALGDEVKIEIEVEATESK